jgi:uncharacterized protein
VTRLAIRVQPGARREGVVGRLGDGTWKVAVTAPPEGGRANAAVVEVLADALGLKARQVTVVKGAASRAKTLEVEGLEAAEVDAKLAAALAAGKG